MKRNKKILILAVLTVVVSCGGGGGGSTSNATPSIPSPSTPDVPIFPTESSKDSNGNIKWNDTTRTYNASNPNNKTSATGQTGATVPVGVLDVGFNTVTQGLKDDIRNKFNGRLISVNSGANQTINENHGIIVSEIIGGNTANGIAKGVTIYAADASNRDGDGEYHPDPTIGMYNELYYNRGVRIFNQSFGIKSEVTDFKWDDPDYVKTQIGDDILNFYKMAVNNGSLFVWAAGNEGYHSDPSLEGGLPYRVNELEKGWINVVGLAYSNKENPGNTEWSKQERLSGAGVAKNWTVTAVSGVTFSSNGSIYEGTGSSFAAPMVTGTAALLKEKYPWMDGSLIRQTILSTATDIGKKGVDEDFGWGLLNIDKALKGPALFDKRLALGDNVVTNVTSGTYAFSNDIAGDAGIIKNGPGELVLSGKNTFTGGTKVNSGRLKLGNRYVSSVEIAKMGTVETTENANLESGIKNEGTYVNSGSNTVIGGNYVASSSSKYVSELGASAYIKGQAELNGTLEASAVKDGEQQYITARGVKENIITSDNVIKGSFSNVETETLLNVDVEKSENSVDVNLSRKNVEDYVSTLSLSDTMRNNVAQNLETSFKELDSQIENGNTENVKSFSRSAALLQKLSLPNTAAVLDSLSGQIYASSQALTFQHSQTVNKDLSNRLVMLGTLDNVGDNAGLWVTGIGANGRLRQEGFGVGKTHTYGGQAGIDKAFGNSLILGAALSYSKSDVKFDRYGGESKGDGFGISLYGRLGNKEVPYYLQGRIGLGFIISNVERDILLGSGDISRAKIEHRDKVYSGYLESGYDAKIGSLTITPYVGLSHDTVERGAFSEENSQFGLTADKKRYNQTSALLGLRLGKSVNWSNGSKTTFQGYVTQYIGFKKQDLSFEAAYSGLSNARFKVEGIGLPKNSTWAGIGVLTEVNPNFAWYVNYDAKMEKNKLNNNVFTTGFRFNF